MANLKYLNIIILVLAVGILLVSCKENSVSNDEPEFNLNVIVKPDKIKGKMFILKKYGGGVNSVKIPWNKKNAIITLRYNFPRAIDTSVINDDGTFELDLPSVLDYKSFEPYYFFSNTINGNYKGTAPLSFFVTEFNDTGKVAYNVSVQAYTDSLNREHKKKHVWICAYENANLICDANGYLMDINVKRGWNLLKYEVISSKPPSYRYRVTVSEKFDEEVFFAITE